MSTDGSNGRGPEHAGPVAEAAVRRRTIIIVVIVIAAIIIAAVLFAIFGLGSSSRQDPGAATSPGSESSASGAPTASGSATPGTPPPPTATVDPHFGAPIAQTVPKNATADFGNKVSAQITKITSTTATGNQAGEVSGPAARVELSITNGTDTEISLNEVNVNAYYGSSMTPASPIGTQDNTVFSGTLGASKTATGSYEFSIPQNQQSSLVITVSRAAGAPIVVFQG